MTYVVWHVKSYIFLAFCNVYLYECTRAFVGTCYDVDVTTVPEGSVSSSSLQQMHIDCCSCSRDRKSTRTSCTGCQVDVWRSTGVWPEKPKHEPTRHSLCCVWQGCTDSCGNCYSCINFFPNPIRLWQLFPAYEDCSNASGAVCAVRCDVLTRMIVIYTSRLVFTARLRPQVRMPPVRNARRTSCPIPSSERAQIPNFRTRSILNLWTRPVSSFWTYLLQRAYVIPCQQQMGSSAVLRARRNALVLAAWTELSRPYLRYGDRVRLQNVSPSVLFESSQIFLQYAGDTDAKIAKKMMDQNFEIRILWFFRIFEFSQRRRAVPLRPIWTLWSRPN